MTDPDQDIPEGDQARKERARKRALLLGLGLDGDDGHVRVTRGENFRLLGGSEEIHEKMTETVIRFNEKLKKRGKRLEEVERDEFRDLLAESMDDG